MKLVSFLIALVIWGVATVVAVTLLNTVTKLSTDTAVVLWLFCLQPFVLGIPVLIFMVGYTSHLTKKYGAEVVIRELLD